MYAALAFQLALGTVMIGLTVVAQAIALDFIIRHAGKFEHKIKRLFKKLWKPLTVSGITVSIFCIHVAIIWIWSFLYLGLSCSPLKNLADSLYFSTVAYTTVGFGDITLGESCRMLSSIEAANGFILFGWTTAFIFEVVSQLYKREAKTLD